MSQDAITGCGQPKAEKPSNKELIQNSLIELDREIEALEKDISSLYGSEEKKNNAEIESIREFSFNTTVIEVTNIVNVFRDRINRCRNDVRQLDTGK